MSPNPPNASNPLAGLPGPAICFSGVQDCRLPALKPPKRFQRSRRPPRQQLLQLHVLKPSKRFQPSRRPPRQQLLQLHAPAICFSGGSRLPFARPQTPQTLPTLSQASKATTLTATCPTLPQASEATTLTATCPCHLFSRGFKTAVCPAPNPPNASNPPAGLQGNNSYSYMPLPSVFQGVQDCRLPALKPPKRFQRSRRPPRQQLLQLHVPAICFSGGSRLPSQAQLHAPAICFSRGSRLPFARPQTLQTLPALPQASKATTLTATCPCHLFFRGFKTAVCPPSNPPNASNAPAGLQGNNSYSYMSLPSVFQGFKTAVASKGTRNVCPASNPPNASARLQGNNSYSYYMPLPSVFQGDCRLPALKPPKRFQRSRRPPRQQLLQLHAPAICFSRGSRLPFARPQTSQTLLTLPQASKATTLTATLCQLHAPDIYHAPAELLHLHAPGRSRLPFARPQTLQTLPGLQGNNSYMPQDVQDCRLPGLKPSKRFRRPPRQQLLQLLHAPAICFSGGSRLPFARPHTPQTLPTLPQASKATTLTATCPCHLFFRGFKTAVCPRSNPPNASQTLPQTLQRSRRPPRQQLLQLPSVSYMPQTSTMLLPNSYTYMPQDVQDCRLPGLKPSKRFRRPPRQQLLQLLHAPAICFSGGSRLPFARPQTPQTLPTLPQASKATTLTATCPCHLFFRGFKTAVCPPSNPPNASNAPAGLQGNNSYSYMSPNPPNASNPLAGLPGPAICFSGVQDCRLPALKPPKRFQRSRRPPRQQLLQLLHAPAICFSGGSRLPFARPQTPQTLPTLPQASKATTLTATCPCHLFFRGFKTAVCPPSNPPNASNAPAGLQGNNSYSYPLSATCPRHLPCSCRTLTPTCPRTFKTAACPASNPPNASAGLQGNNSYSYYMPLPSVFQGAQDCRLPALKPPKRFQRSRRPPRQQLLQLHAPAICFSGGSRLPFARPQTPQTLPTLPQASKATTLTATCPQTLQTLPTLSQASQALPSVFQGFKTAVCPPSNPPNASNAPAGLQGNNSYSYMSSNPDLTDVFFLLGKLCGYCVPTAAWALHVSRALRYHACAFEANDASAADCGLSRQSLATFGTNKAWIAAAISTGDMRIRRSWMSWGVSQYFILVASPQWRHEYSPISIIIPLLRMEYI